MLKALTADLRVAVAVGASHRLFVRAGGVGGAGCGIVIPGQPRSSASTLVAALVRAGADYYSDTLRYSTSTGASIVLEISGPSGGQRAWTPQPLGAMEAPTPDTTSRRRGISSRGSSLN